MQLDEELWMILFKSHDDRVPAKAEEMLAYFHDWKSWLSLFAAMHTGQPAEMTVYGPRGAELCKVIHRDQFNSRSTYDNPLGLSSYDRRNL